MASRASYFDKTVFRSCVTRFWPLWCAYLVAWFLALPLNVGSALRWDGAELRIGDTILEMGRGNGATFTLIFAVVAAMAVYSFVYGSKSAGLYCSLPLRRETLFLSAFAAGLSCMLTVNVVTFLLTVGAEAAAGHAELKYALSWLGMVSLETLFFFGFASFCATLTGNLFVLPVLYFVLSLGFWAAEGVVRYILQTLLYGMKNGSYALNFLSPVVYISQNTWVQGVAEQIPNAANAVVYREFYFTGWWALGIYALVGIAFAVCAVLLFRRRHMETAGDVVALPVLRPAFKYCLSVSCGLGAAASVYNYFFENSFASGVSVAVLVCLLLTVGSLVGYFAAEMLNRKTLKVFKGKVWRGWLITAAALVVLAALCEADVLGFETKLPARDEVVRAYVGLSGGELIEEPQNIDALIEAQRGVIENKKLHEAEGHTSFNIVYFMKDGSTMERVYDIAVPSEYNTLPWEGSDAQALERLINTREAIERRTDMIIPVTAETVEYATVEWWDPEQGFGYQLLELTPEEALELYACVKRDADRAAIGRGTISLVGEVYKTVCAAAVTIEVVQKDELTDEYRSDRLHVRPCTDSTAVNAWLKERGIEPRTLAEHSAAEQAEYGSDYASDSAAYAEKYYG